ncbi:Rho1 guanine nucleotide exchange factor 1 [Choanephora cucurbitarum]|uniref:Rho1 guanine nucleotide exchange factor 1 n=1 Tax=Choanephora cucurbitarum TaxID=101091 RepID=A0A1C7N9C7_9FUNG|nr:Rho1 guanine nucleotide exchange factor 1 [Choanephora cucurbitarum]
MALIDSLSEIPEDVENSYIRQNLPVRRQSLIVYRDKLKNEEDTKKKLNSQTIPGTMTNRLYNSKSMNSISSKKQDRAPNPPLSIQTDFQTTQSSISISSSGSSNRSPQDLFLGTLFEENQQESEQLQHYQSSSQRVTRFIGRLKQSKSDSTHRNRQAIRRKSQASEEILSAAPTSSPLSQSWNEVSLPLSRLKNVFHRLQTNNHYDTDTGKSNKCYTQELGGRKTKSLFQTDNKKDGVYIALLSHVSSEFLRKIQLSDIAFKDGIQYHDIFYGSEAVDCISEILSINDRTLALLVGRALEIQGLFHHVNYDRELRDLETELYQIEYIGNQSTQAFRPTSTYFVRAEQEQQLRSLWRHSVPTNVVLGTNNLEQKRQECIYELIYTEDDFTRDLHYVQDFWIEPLLHDDIIPAERRNDFVIDVFWNWADIERISTNLSKDLTERQDRHSIIPSIGDILLRHIEHFEPFVTYGAHQIIGKHMFELEKKRNSKFLQFVKKTERQPEARRLELNGYLTKPTSRLGRYNLLLEAIHRLTPEDHKDAQDIPKVMDKITRLLVQLNKKVGLSDNAFHLEQISSRILAPKAHNLDLLNTKRQLLMRGKMKKCNINTSKNTSPVVSPSNAVTDIQVFLFDHYLVFCKIKYQGDLEFYKLYQKPIPVENLFAFIPDSVIIPSTKAFSTSALYNKLSPSTFHNSVSDTTSLSQGKHDMFPITFHNHSNPTSSPITLVVSTESTRNLWLNKIEELQEKLGLYCT